MVPLTVPPYMGGGGGQYRGSRGERGGDGKGDSRGDSSWLTSPEGVNQPVHEVAKRGHEDGQHDEVDPLHQVWQDDPPANYIGREGRGGEGRGGEGRGGRGGEGRGEKGRGEWRGGEGRGEEERGEWRGGEGRGEEGRGEGRGGEGRECSQLFSL